jgi:hypothetical protein
MAVRPIWSDPDHWLATWSILIWKGDKLKSLVAVLKANPKLFQDKITFW